MNMGSEKTELEAETGRAASEGRPKLIGFIYSQNVGRDWRMDRVVLCLNTPSFLIGACLDTEPAFTYRTSQKIAHICKCDWKR